MTRRSPIWLLSLLFGVLLSLPPALAGGGGAVHDCERLHSSQAAVGVSFDVSDDMERQDLASCLPAPCPLLGGVPLTLTADPPAGHRGLATVTALPQALPERLERPPRV